MPNPPPPIAQELLSHQTFLRRLAIDLVGKDADDLVQDVWQRALEHPPHHGGQLRGWLARIARNLAANRWRAEARRRSREERRARVQSAGEELEARFELRKELVGALDSLSQPCRETILLRYFEGLPARDIASRQGIPVATVKTRLRRALGQLREALDKRHGGDRATWMSAVTALAAPAGGGVETGTLVIGGILMGAMLKVSAAVLVAAVCVYFVTRTPGSEVPRVAAVDSLAGEMELEDAAVLSAAEGPARSAGGRSPVAEEPTGDVSAARGTNVLRVVLEGITDEHARRTRFTLTGVDKRRDEWPSHISVSWPCQGLTSEFDLDPFFARVAGATNWNLHVDELEVKAVHPLHLIERTRVSLSRGVELKSGQTTYEARVRLVPGVPHVFWPELTLAVRDVHTRAHLEGVELRCVPTSFMGYGQVPGTDPIFTSVGAGLSSPIVLLGGREADVPEDRFTGLALGPAAGEAPQLLELVQSEATDRGVVVFARAPGYAWDTIVLDVSTGGERELLLGPASGLEVRVANVQLERYAALETEATLWVRRFDAIGVEQRVWFQGLDETLATEGLRLESLEPGEYAVSVELGVGSWKKRPVLAREELSLAAGETRELRLALADPQAPQERATLGGVVSFPAFGGEEKVRIQLYFQTYRHGDAEPRSEGRDHGRYVELSLANLERVGGALPTWSFRLENLPVGLYQVQVSPFLKRWMIELPAAGREDVELVIPELAEVLVETFDAGTGERIPLDVIRYRYERAEVLPGQVTNDWAVAELEEPGRFRFWTAPGAANIWPGEFPSGLDYGTRNMDLELVPGLQSVRFEFEPVYAIRFEFRDGEAVLPRGDSIYWRLAEGIRAVDHDGQLTNHLLYIEKLVEMSAPGVYEVSFEGVGAGRFHPIPPRRIDVRAGETTEVIVVLRRK